MKTSLRAELPQLVLIVAMFAWAAVRWSTLPDEVPVHWNLQGDVDGYGGKFAGLLLLPLITVILYVTLLLLPRLDPGYANYQRFAKAYLVIRTATVGLMGAVYAAMQIAIEGHNVRMEVVMPILLGIMFVVFGNLMGKVRPNWFVGIRTPWTLSSKRAWNKTHRFGGWVFILLGVVVIVAGVVHSGAAIVVLIAGTILSLAVIVVYSYVAWRDDPDRIPPTGTAPA